MVFGLCFVGFYLAVSEADYDREGSRSQKAAKGVYLYPKEDT